jgi:hypothetical protein
MLAVDGAAPLAIGVAAALAAAGVGDALLNIRPSRPCLGVALAAAAGAGEAASDAAAFLRERVFGVAAAAGDAAGEAAGLASAAAVDSAFLRLRRLLGEAEAAGEAAASGEALSAGVAVALDLRARCFAGVDAGAGDSFGAGVWASINEAPPKTNRAVRLTIRRRIIASLGPV